MNFGVTGVNQKEELLKQLKTISEALDKQTEKKVKICVLLWILMEMKYINVENVLYVVLNLAALIT